MLPGTHAGDGNVRQLLKVEHRLSLAVPYVKGGVQFPVLHQPQQGGEGHHPHGGAHQGKFLRELPKNFRQEIQLPVAVAAHLKVGQIRPPTQVLSGGKGGPQDQIRVREKTNPLGGQGDALAGAVEQLHPQLILQRLDLVADGGLRDSQSLRGPGKIQVLRHRHEALQLHCIHETSYHSESTLLSIEIINRL